MLWSHLCIRKGTLVSAKAWVRQSRETCEEAGGGVSSGCARPGLWGCRGVVRSERRLGSGPHGAIELNCKALACWLRRLAQQRVLRAEPWPQGHLHRKSALVWLWPLPLCHRGAHRLPARAPFLPFSPSLGFESYDSHHPPFTCPESAEDLMRWGSPSPPSLCHHLGFRAGLCWRRTHRRCQRARGWVPLRVGSSCQVNIYKHSQPLTRQHQHR